MFIPGIQLVPASGTLAIAAASTVKAQSPVSPNTTATIIKDIVEPLTIGKDIYDVESIWHNNYSSKRERGHYTGFYIDAICGVDIAIWDAIGKSLNSPIISLHGWHLQK